MYTFGKRSFATREEALRHLLEYLKDDDSELAQYWRWQWSQELQDSNLTTEVSDELKGLAPTKGVSPGENNRAE